MKKLALFGCSLALTLLAPSALFADTIFNFSFGTSFVRGSSANVPYGASGQLDTQATSTPGVYLIVGATGTVTGVPTGYSVKEYAITGVAPAATQVGGGFNNLLTFENGMASFNGNDGVTFLFGTGSVDLRNGIYPAPPYVLQLLSDLYYQDGAVQRSEYAVAGFSATLSSPPAAATPEPGTFVLLGTGLVGMVSVARRKLMGREALG